MQSLKTEKVFVGPKNCIPKFKPMHKKLGCYKPSPLKMNLVLEIRWLRTEEGGEIISKLILSFPSGFLLGVITPLDLTEFNLPSSGETNSFFQNPKGYFSIGQVGVEVEGAIIDVLEHLRLVGHLEASSK